MRGGKLTLEHTRLESNVAYREGGGLYVASGSAVLGNQTLLDGNWAPMGQQASIRSGEMLYYLPAPSGRWVPSVRMCTVERQRRQQAACDPSQQPALPWRAAVQCATIPNSATAVRPF